MCGIAGIAGAPPDSNLLEAMAKAMANRGPDAQATWCGDGIGLAFRRLAIIDLHERSSQPMSFERWHLVFNGEIYNYRELRDELAARGHGFATEGDGEVLLHAWAEWGEGALDRFNGMFAFAVWDDDARTLTLATDPFGEKPLYYAREGERLVFGSRLDAIALGVGRASGPDARALQGYLARGAFPGLHDSFVAGVKRLPGAHVLRWRDGILDVRRYWTPARRDVPTDYRDATAALRELLESSVRLRLRSDVSVGTSLSGGVDSSAMVALVGATGHDQHRHSFTARFQGFERDEWPYAAAAADAAGVAGHHAIDATAANLSRDLPQLVADHEEPVVSSSVYAQWCVMQRAKEAGITVLLDGQGGDEVFAGYPEVEGFALRSMGRGRALRRIVEQPRAGRAVLSSLALELARRTRAGHRAATLYRRGRLTSPYASEVLVSESLESEVTYDPWQTTADPLRRELLLQGFRTVLPQLLRYADRSSMAHSREVRLPLLDRRIAEFAYSLPASFINDGVRPKRILRDAVADLVPAQVLARSDKVGFETPQRIWLAASPLRETAAEVLLDPLARERGIYDVGAIEEDVRGGAWRDPSAIWRALNTELWLRHLSVRDRDLVPA
jgi:asparagine synthase (glutamine-hydrolysing)